MTILEWRCSLLKDFFWEISIYTLNPNPPIIIKSAIVIFIIKSPPTKGTMLSPIISKPALQKADMEWNKEYHRPVIFPNLGINLVDSNIAPINSIRNVEKKLHI